MRRLLPAGNVLCAVGDCPGLAGIAHRSFSSVLRSSTCYMSREPATASEHRRDYASEQRSRPDYRVRSGAPNPSGGGGWWGMYLLGGLGARVCVRERMGRVRARGNGQRGLISLQWRGRGYTLASHVAHTSYASVAGTSGVQRGAAAAGSYPTPPSPPLPVRPEGSYGGQQHKIQYSDAFLGGTPSEWVPCTAVWVPRFTAIPALAGTSP